MHRYLADTAEMPAWTGEEHAPSALYSWDEYTDLGPFKPNWTRNRTTAPYAYRVQHNASHAAGLRKGSLKQRVVSIAREIGNKVALAFLQVGEFA